MELPTIQSIKQCAYDSTTTLFVQCKGLHSGRPLTKPIPNCFAVICKSAEDREYYHWLTWGLWQTKAFHYYLRGSVVPFICLSDYKEMLIKHAITSPIQRSEMVTTVTTLIQLNEYEAQSLRSIKLIQEMRRAIFLKLLKRK